MKEKDQYSKIEIPEPVLNSIKTAHETFSKVIKNIGAIMPKINMPDMKGFEVKLPPNPDIVYEQNAWERHNETMEIENAILNVQNHILKEQKSTSTLTLWILVLTIAMIIIGVCSIVITILYN